MKIIEGSYVDQIQDTNGNNTNFNKITKTRSCYNHPIQKIFYNKIFGVLQYP